MESSKEPNLKRKRVEGAKEDLGTRISGKLHHELHEVHVACKKAKTFETQKLVKRLKQIRQKNDDQAAIKDHEAQLECIKSIDHNRLANTAFRTKILKDKPLKGNQLVQDALTKEINANILEAPTAGTPQAKVQSRLLSSKIIASQVATSLASLKHIVNPEAPPTKKTRPQSPGAATASASKSKSSTKPLKPSAKTQRDADGWDSSSDDEDDGGRRATAEGQSDAGDDAGWESGTVDGDSDDDSGDSDENEGGFEASEDGEDGWESGSIHGSDSEQGDDASASDSDDTSSCDLKVKAPQKKGAKTPTAATASSSSKKSSKVESTFLPSLSMGYVVADSDASDIEDGPAVAEPRKNRRGQRARRAIWEKKYGNGANHMKVEAQKEQERTTAKAKAKAESNLKPLPRPDSGWVNRKSGAAPSHGQSHNGIRAPERFKAPATEKALHPSWEAKRKLKEKEGAAIVPSQGKKITF